MNTTTPREPMNRGDVILVRFPHPAGLRGKKRPAVVVQSDAYAGAVSTLIPISPQLTTALLARGPSSPARGRVKRGLANASNPGFITGSVITLSSELLPCR